MKIEFYKHELNDEDKNEVMKVLDSIFLSTGEWTFRFEEKFASYLDAEYAVGLSSGTSALELALAYYNIKKGDEVITTPMSYVATATAIECRGAKPVFVDVEEDTGNINADLIEDAISKNTKAILPVHLYGQMCDMRKIRSIADKYNLKVIEDSAHCIEGQREDVKPGELGDVACFSFYATKNITSGEGGAIVCKRKEEQLWYRSSSSHGVSKIASERHKGRYEHYDMHMLGYKCNMSNIQAALLINQIDRMNENLKRREVVAKMYDNAFVDNSNIKLMKVVNNVKHAHHLYTIRIHPKNRDAVIGMLNEAGIGVAINYRSIHLMDYFSKKYSYGRGDYPICERIGDTTVSIPLYPKLRSDEVEYIIKTLNNI